MADLDINALARSILRIGDLQIDVGRLCVVGRGEEGRLPQKSIAVLIELARHPMATVTRAELLDRVWPNSIPTPDVLSQAIRELRRAFGDDAKAPRFIETVHGLGYRLLVPLTVETSDARPPTSSAPPPESIARHAEPAASHPDREHDAAFARAPSPDRRRAVIAAIASALSLAALFAFVSSLETSAVTRQASSTSSVRLITSDPGAEEFPKLSPDGGMVAFTRRANPDGRYDLAVMSINGSEPVMLTETPDVDELWPAWSPDGASIAYVRIDGERCGIHVVPATGGDARRVATCDRIVFSGIDWSADGTHLVTSLPSASTGRELRVHRIPLATGGAPVALDYVAPGAGWDRDPVYSPDGRWIAFRRGVPDVYDIFVMRSDGGEARRLTQLGSVGEQLSWSPDGRDVMFWSEHEGVPSIYRADLGTGEVRSTGITHASRPNVSRRSGRLVFQRPWLRVGIATVDVRDPASPPQQIAASTGTVGFIAGAPDQRRLAYVSDRGGFEQVWIHELDAGRADRAYGDASLGRVRSLDWSDDGRRVLVVARRGDRDVALILDLGTGAFLETGLVRPLLRDAVFAERADRLYALVADGSSQMLSRFDRVGTTWRESRTAIAATAMVRQAGVPGVFAGTPLRGDVILRISPELEVREIALQPRVFGWAVGSGAIWYVRSVQRAVAELHRLDLATGEDTTIRQSPHQMPRRRPTLVALGDRVVVPVLVEDAADLGLVDPLQ